MLTALQLELLKTFSRPIPDEQILEIKRLLADYFARKVDEGVDALFTEKSWNVDTIDEWAQGHSRIPYIHD